VTNEKKKEKAKRKGLGGLSSEKKKLLKVPTTGFKTIVGSLVIFL